MRDLIEGILRGDHRTIARAITLIENDRRKAQKIIRGIYTHTGNALVIGMTGAPGTGKSCLVDGLAGMYRKKEKKVGIIAVDPSSPFSGGAILGDRIRMMRHSADPGIFIRSMATRGNLGGLAASTGETLSVLDAAGMDIVFIETVGVGQDEVDVVKFADIVCLVLIPGAGDDIQVFKAGIMEIADAFVLNKTDLAGSEKTEMQLRSVLEMASEIGSPVPLVKTSADRGEGIEHLAEIIEEKATVIRSEDGKFQKKRWVSWMLREIIKEKLWRSVFAKIPEAEIEAGAERIRLKKTDPYSVAEELIKRWDK
ncbi:MAG: methylmalonyl Co-A mutase-associated GTPase MeaB [Candidatus Aminicenantes bacterium]|nr:methylmalonyl Co-A mutase-associated GTPase MeaB [Candidatus Aminicenantes bacterium]